MSNMIFEIGLSLSQFMIVISMIATTYRLVRGPEAQDRIIAFDALYMTTMLLFVSFSIRFHTALYFEAALIIAILGFVSNVALAKFLIRGEVIE